MPIVTYTQQASCSVILVIDETDPSNWAGAAAHCASSQMTAATHSCTPEEMSKLALLHDYHAARASLGTGTVARSLMRSGDEDDNVWATRSGYLKATEIVAARYPDEDETQIAYAITLTLLPRRMSRPMPTSSRAPPSWSR
jgi:hypothetical protein